MSTAPATGTHHVTAAAALTMVCAALCFSLLDATSKHLVQSFPATLLVWLRYCMQTFLLVLLWGPRMGRNLVVTRSPKLQVLRGMLLVFSTLMMVLAFRAMPLADATAINFAAPSIVTILAVAFLRERMTAARLVSVVAGMVGVLLIVRPGTDVFQGAAIYPLVAALASASYQVLTRKLAAEDARTTMFYSVMVGAVATTLTTPWSGTPLSLDGRHVVEITAIGVFATAGHFLFIRALQMAPASGLASITYVQLVFATAIGWVVFGNLPDQWALIGMIVIMASGLFLTWYERRRAVVALVEPPAAD